VEPFINNYQKFNSNSGWACDDEGWSEVGSSACVSVRLLQFVQSTYTSLKLQRGAPSTQ
jgi:hypothetical protein